MRPKFDQSINSFGSIFIRSTVSFSVTFYRRTNTWAREWRHKAKVRNMFAHEQCLVWYTRSRLLSSLTFSIHIQFIMFVLSLIKIIFFYWRTKFWHRTGNYNQTVLLWSVCLIRMSNNKRIVDPWNQKSFNAKFRTHLTLNFLCWIWVFDKETQNI